MRCDEKARGRNADKKSVAVDMGAVEA